MNSEPHGRTLAAAEQGCLALGDVTGYSDYLRDTELEHAQDVLADLLETVLRHLAPNLRFSKLEGDAVLAYALESEIEPSMLLDTIEETYFAFRSRLRDITHATTCDCNACQLIPRLDLKFLIHHGRFVRHPMGGSEELTGTDVVLVHRLLKNTIEDRLGLRGYAFLTEACVTALGIAPDAIGMTPHREDVDDTGSVNGYVTDLEERWRYEDERRRVYVTPADAEVEQVQELPAPPPVAWEYLTAPQKRALWGTSVTSIDEQTAGGRRGVGTTTHCVHGRAAITEEILDWRPFRYFTHRRVMPGFGPMVFTWELHPVGEDRSEVRVRVDRLRGVRQRALWAVSRRRVLAQSEQLLSRLRRLIADETGAMTSA